METPIAWLLRRLKENGQYELIKGFQRQARIYAKIRAQEQAERVMENPLIKEWREKSIK